MCIFRHLYNPNPNPNHNPNPNFQSIGPLVNRYFWSIIFGLLDLLSVESPRKWRLSASKKIKSACGHCSFTTPIFPPLTKVLNWNHCMRVFIIVIFSHRYPDSDSILLKTCVFFTVYWSIRMFIQLMQTSTLFSFQNWAFTMIAM